MRANGLNSGQHRVPDGAADVLVIDVDPLRARRLQPLGHVRRAMVDAIVEAELVAHVGAFVGTAGDPDRARAAQLGDLPDHRADRAAGGGDRDGLARLRLADVLQPGPRGHARHAEHAQRRRGRRPGLGQLAHRLGVAERPFLPAGPPGHQVALGESRRARGNHPADHLAGHHLADLHRRGVRRPVAHPPAHVGVEREPDRAQQDLAVAGLRGGLGLDAEIVRRRRALGPAGEHDAAVGVRHIGLL